jgi:hypothetical protein
MTISGHKTASMFQRYNVTSSTDQVDALKKTAAHLAALRKDGSGNASGCRWPVNTDRTRKVLPETKEPVFATSSFPSKFGCGGVQPSVLAVVAWGGVTRPYLTGFRTCVDWPPTRLRLRPAHPEPTSGPGSWHKRGIRLPERKTAHRRSRHEQSGRRRSIQQDWRCAT